MKKSVMTISVILLFVFVVGCLDYKAYDIPEEDSEEDLDLLQEIAEIERELEQQDTASDTTGDAGIVVEEVVLPELGSDEESEETSEEGTGEEPAEDEGTEEGDAITGDVVADEEKILPELEDDSLKTVTVKESELVKLSVDISDPDDDPVTYTFSQPLNANGEWQTQYSDAGEYVVTITATDGKLTTSQKVRIVVERVNVPPVISGVKNLIVDEGEVVKFSPTVTDPNQDEVTVTVSEPLRTGVFATDHTSGGEYLIKVLATDGELEAEQEFTLTVNDINVVPVIDVVKQISVKEGETVRIDPRITDLDEEDSVTVTISDPVGDDGIWETTFTDNGEYTVTVVADDGKDRATERVVINVEDVNMPPEIVDIVLS